MRVVYLLRRFPVLTQTFVSREIMELVHLGYNISICSYLPPRDLVRTDYVEPLLSRTIYGPRLHSWRFWRANLHWLLHAPRSYLRGLARIVSVFWGHWAELGRALYFALTACWFATKLENKPQQTTITHFLGPDTAGCVMLKELLAFPFMVRVHTAIEVKKHYSALLKDASWVVADYDALADHLKLNSPSCSPRIRVMPQIMNLSSCIYLKPEARPTVTLLSVGSLVESKGHSYLLSACRILRARNLTFRCLIIGEGPLRRKLEVQIRDEQLHECVELVGAVAHEKLFQYYALADIFVLANVTSASTADGLPTVVLEAAASGRPIVASQAAGVPAGVQHELSGVLVTPRDPEALAGALERLIKDERLRYTMGMAGRDFILDHYVPEIVIRQLIECL